jgi:hypothetical protein
MATSLTIDRTSMRQIAAAMAFVMMMASLPSIGVIVTNTPASTTTGLLTLTITSPSGVATIVYYNINWP